MSKGHILVVEDEKDISDLIKLQLSSNGYKVTVIANGSEAIELVQTHPSQRTDTTPIDLFVLDRMLPGINGQDICKFLRVFKHTKQSPILMVTALSSTEHIVEGLDAGADDYITKPFDISILLARVRSLLRRSDLLSSQGPNEDILSLGPVTLDKDQCKVSLKGSPIDLTLSEYKLMVAFLQQPGKVLTRNQLVEFIQDGPVHVTDRTIDTHIFGLRKKLNEYSDMIETIRGIGYRVKNDL